MTIDRDIILDLLPLCQSGLASEPSRQLVEAWLATHPEERPEARPGAVGAGRRRHRALAGRGGCGAGSAGSTGWPSASPCCSFTSEFHFDARPARLRAAAGARLPAGRSLPVILAAIACWAGYVLLKRRLS